MGLIQTGASIPPAVAGISQEHGVAEMPGSVLFAPAPSRRPAVAVRSGPGSGPAAVPADAANQVKAT